MSTTTCPHADTARSAAAIYEAPAGNSRSSDVCDKNTRHPPPPAPPAPATRPATSVAHPRTIPAPAPAATTRQRNPAAGQ